MSKKKNNIDALKRALDYDWPEIQKHLIEQSAEDKRIQEDEDGAKYHIDDEGRKVLHLDLDSWWLDRFDRDDVIMEMPGLVLMNSKPWHRDSICSTVRDAYDVSQNQDCDDCFAPKDILAHIERFPEGQFVAMRISGPVAGNAVAAAVTMRTSRPPSAPALPWLEAIGDMRLGAHEPNGQWLYGVELAVHSMYRGLGIATNLYQLRFQLIKQLNLRGWYVIGMLMGYKRYADTMNVREYGEKVVAGEIKDPTVSLQLKRGFRPKHVVTDYCDEPAAGDAGLLMVWENPDYRAGAVAQ